AADVFTCDAICNHQDLHYYPTRRSSDLAFNQGKNLAKNIINKNTSPFKVIPYFWSDQYNDSFEYLGHIKNWNRSEIEGNIENGMFSITYYDQLDKPQAVFFTNGYKNKKEVQDYLIKNKA